MRAESESHDVLKEISFGRALALTALAPIAGRLADEREREQRESERQRQLSEALAAAPPLERPEGPDDQPRTSLRDCVSGMIGWTIGLFVLSVIIYGFGFYHPGVAFLLSAALGASLASWRYWWELWTIGNDRQAYEQCIREADARDIERQSIRAEFEEGEL